MSAGTKALSLSGTTISAGLGSACDENPQPADGLPAVIVPSSRRISTLESVPKLAFAPSLSLSQWSACRRLGSAVIGPMD